MPVITTIASIAATAAINGALAIGLGSAAWTIGSIVGFAAPLALAVGLSYAQSALAKTQTGGSGPAVDTPAGVNAPEVRGNVKNAVPPQRIPIGRVRTGGAMFLYEVIPPYLYVGFLYSSLPIDGFETLYIGEQTVTFSSLPDNTIVSPIDVEGQADFPNRLSVCVQRGTLNQGVNALIAADLGSLFDTTYFETPGVANAVFKCHYGSDADEFLALWGNVQIPNFQWLLRGVCLPDPRAAGARLSFDMDDPEDLYHAVSTWPFSDTAALAQAFWASMPFGLRAGPRRMNWESVAASAGFDEEVAALSDGSGFEKRHVVSCLATLADKPNVVMDALFTANRGFPSQRAGEFHIYSSQPRDPVLTITDAMLVGGFEFRRLKPKKDLINIAACTYVSPDDEWQDTEGPTDRRDTLIESDGEEFQQRVRLSCTPGTDRAQRILAGFIDEARLERFLNCKCTMAAYGLREGDIVRRYSETGRYTHQDGLYSVEEWQLAGDRSSVALSLAEYDPTIARRSRVSGVETVAV
jgi:hypothetical protein